MKKYDEEIREALKKGQKSMNDDLFTERIVHRHLKEKKQVRSRPFLNFSALIGGLVMVLISFMIYVYVKLDSLVFEEVNFDEQHGQILLCLSFLFLVYKWLEDYFESKMEGNV